MRPPRRHSAPIYLLALLFAAPGLLGAQPLTNDRHTLTLWSGAPQTEYVSKETGDKVILRKDRPGRVIGFERLNYSPGTKRPIEPACETLAKARQGRWAAAEQGDPEGPRRAVLGQAEAH